MGAKNSVAKRNVSCTVCTWNLGNTCPTTGFSWIGAERESDIYAIGVQEAIYDKRDGFIDMEMDLFVSLHKELGEDKYDIVSQQSLTPRTDKTYVNEAAFVKAYRDGKASPSGIRIIVFVKKTLAGEGFPIDSESVDVNLQTCGRLGGVSGNKGGINVSMRIGETWISFMSAHFNAHTEELERRVLDYGSVMAGLHPVADDFGEKVDYQVMEADDQQYIRNVEQVNKCHVMFAFGDFNFRLEPMEADGVTAKPKPDDFAEVVDDVELRQFDAMAGYDQLIREREKGRVFHGFVEKEPGHPTFIPTFKLNKKGPERWNPKRVPSWCDRVLWRTIGPQITCHRYVSHPEPGYAPNTSDHTPVSAWFDIEVRKAGAHHKGGIGGTLSRLKSRGSSVKQRTMVVSGLKWEPDITHIVPLFMEDVDEVTEAQAIGTIKQAKLYISMYHSALKERQKTKTQPWNDAAVNWPEVIKLETKSSVEDVTASPLLICLRNSIAMENKTHRFGEVMLDLRELADASAKGVGSFRVEVMQRGTPRGFVSGNFAMSGVA